MSHHNVVITIVNMCLNHSMYLIFLTLLINLFNEFFVICEIFANLQDTVVVVVWLLNYVRLL